MFSFVIENIWGNLGADKLVVLPLTFLAIPPSWSNVVYLIIDPTTPLPVLMLLQINNNIYI